VNTHRRGRTVEIKTVAYYRERGFVAYRLAHGAADVIALTDGRRPQLLQVKSTRRPFEHFRTADRDALLADAEAAGAEPVLVWWPPRQSAPRLILPAEWPRTRRLAVVA
jgi:Holliday junction resolvase